MILRRRVASMLSSAYPHQQLFLKSGMPDSGPHDVPGVLPRHVEKRMGVRGTSRVRKFGSETAHRYPSLAAQKAKDQPPVWWARASRNIRLKQWFEALPRSCLEAIESVSMDMWPAFINATLERVPGAESKIAFDKFHVAKYLGEAVDKVRREEHRKLMKAGKADLKGTKYDHLSNPKNMTRRQKQRFKALRDSTLKTARAWAIKELAMSLWGYVQCH